MARGMRSAPQAKTLHARLSKLIDLRQVSTSYPLYPGDGESRVCSFDRPNATKLHSPMAGLMLRTSVGFVICDPCAGRGADVRHSWRAQSQLSPAGISMG